MLNIYSTKSLIFQILFYGYLLNKTDYIKYFTHNIYTYQKLTGNRNIKNGT
jgi:hypothetical protein